jgi:hypothetical protein
VRYSARTIHAGDPAAYERSTDPVTTARADRPRWG